MASERQQPKLVMVIWSQMKLLTLAAVAGALVLSRSAARADAPPAPAVKDYLLGALAKMESAADDFVKKAAAYQQLVDANGGDPARAFGRARDQIAPLIETLRDDYKAMDSFGYETIEGIVAGVGALSDFDIYLDAGVPQSQAGGGTPVAPVVLALPNGQKLDREGCLFTYIIEPMLWGANQKYVVPADLDGDGQISERESLPRADVLSAAALDVRAKIHELRATAVAWQPSTADYFSAIITMTPTLSGYFDDWKESRYAPENSGKFTAVSRVSDMRGIMSSVAVLYAAVHGEVSRKDPALANSIQHGFEGILAFINRVDTREKKFGARMTSPEIDEMAEEAKQKADKLVPQVEQAAAILDVKAGSV
jgi:hypothetical protein